MKNKLGLFAVVVITFCICHNVFAEEKTQDYLLLPAPKQIEYKKGFYSQSVFTKKPIDALEQTLNINPKAITHAQGYELRIAANKIIITANNPAGAFYAQQTLKQIAKQTGNENARCLKITDWPDYPARGVMIDISRDKVPTMQTLYNLIDMLASWKINQFQLYTEHTFAYKNHKDIWKDASPMTAEQIRTLDAYCKERFIDLVPNQNSFGHMERWLKHENYRYMAEAPDYVDTSWGKRRWHVLYPAEPNSIKLVAELYDELLPNFTSKYFNVGCDETIELGNGRSKELCQKIGMEQVYIEFVLKIYDLVKQHNRTMMFWADMIEKRPDVMAQLPNDAIALIWGYRAEHPFDKYCQTVASTGRQFYVCPGTSGWQSISGKTDNAMANLLNAAQNGLKHGAIGYLTTDWGDLGDWEPIIVGYPGFAYGAALSWSTENNKDIDVPAILSKFAFEDSENIMGKLMYDLGNAYKISNVLIGNASVISKILLYPDWDLDKKPQSELTVEGLNATKAYVDSVIANLDKANITKSDSAIVAMEIKHIAGLIKHGCDLGIARLGAEDKKTVNIPKDVREKLAADMKRIMEDHKKVWLSRNRPGGLDDSLARMQKQLDLYEQ